ncbi:hypothetical protein ACFQ15_04475 [Sphingomonas hankookensis]|uniref:hypothetical protein n=1 Tax=Sphingomonas hankookensis TaxID=563996 RepID=UPI001F5ACD87|nr:hypothetical protein [Sphingomonas hankookensis]
MDRHAIFLSGPIGTGKTTLGRGLAARLSGGFIDGDDFSDPAKPWYCSILQTSRSIVHHASMRLQGAGVVVVAYPLSCMNWIYFRRHFADIGVTPVFVSLHASYAAITDDRRGRAFSTAEHDRIKAMIAEGYGNRSFSDLVIDTGKADFQATLASLEQSVRSLMASSGPANP